MLFESPHPVTPWVQVMLRGAHVPLGEVEAVLEELPGVEQAVALVQEDPTGVQRLVAYVTPSALSAPELLAGLRGRLPARMMPSTITPLAEVHPPGQTSCRCHAVPVSERQPHDSTQHHSVCMHLCQQLLIRNVKR